MNRVVELTAMQRSLWSSQVKSPDSAHLNTALLWHIDGALDTQQLAAAFASVVAASDILRTTIVSDAGKASVVLSHAPAVTNQLSMNQAEAQAWAVQRAAMTMNETVALFDSVVVSHGDGTTSWFLNLHHVITDATSSALVFAATARAYMGESVELDSYYEWAASQAESERNKSAQQYWTDRESSAKVGRIYGPKAVTTSSADRVEVDFQPIRDELSDLLSGRLASISEDLAWTTFLLTASAVLVHRTSGAEAFSLGLPLHNRSGSQAQAVVGPVMEVFPVAIEVAAGDTFASLHKRISRSAMETIRRSKPGSAPNQASYETVVNVIPRGGVAQFGSHDATTTWVHPGTIDPAHLLEVQLTTYAGGPPRIELDVNHSVGSESERLRISSHFESVINQFVSDPDSSIGAFGLPATDETVALTSWGLGPEHKTAGSVDVVGSLKTALLANHQIALTDREQVLTGPQVWQRVEALAKTLIASGVGKGCRVGIDMERSVDAVLAIYATLAAGASYVPLDPDQPQGRRDKLASRAGCVRVLRELPQNELGLDAIELPKIALSDEAYLLFTSGSTGEPKGVPITHQGLADYLAYAEDAYEADSSTTAALFTPLTFDLTVTSLFVPVIAGGRLLTIAPDGLEGLMEVANSQQVTWLKATPSHLEILLRLLKPGPQLKSIVVGGEAFTSRLARQLWVAFEGVSLFNEYGPTEAVVGCMYHKASEGQLRNLPDVPIGIPSPGVSLLVVDKYSQPVPIGAVGELLIASRGLTAGYLPGSDGSDPGAGKFVEITGTRYYRSGDLVRLIDSKTLVYQGRADSQIKVGGIRLEPTEVEAQLEAHPAVRRAVARLWSPKHDASEASEVFTGWIELVDGAVAPSPGEMRVFLAERLPRHAIPAAFVPVDELPTSVNGKLADSELPSPGQLHRAVHADRLAASSDTERTVIGVWEHILNTGPLGADDDFFALGGDSLAALEMVVSLGDELGHPLPEKFVFSHTTPRELATAIDLMSSGVTPELEAPSARESDGASVTTALPQTQLPLTQLALTPWEQGFVFEQMNDPDSGRQNVGRRYLVEGEADIARLVSAIQATVERHVPLHLTLSLDERVMLPASKAVEISAGFSPIDLQQLDEIALDAIDKPLDIENGPLTRFAIHPIAAEAGANGNRTGVVVVAHHGVNDLASFEQIWADIDQSYKGLELEPLDDAYRANAVSHAQVIANADISWISADQPVAERLDLTVAGSQVGDASGNGYVQHLASFTAEELAIVPGASPMASLLAGLAASLRPLNPSDGLTIALPISVRDRTANELAGSWLNVVPVQIPVVPGQPFTELLKASSVAVGDALGRKMVPPSTVNKVRRDLGLEPVDPQIVFAYSEFVPSELGGMRCSHEVLSGSQVRSEVAFFAEVREGQISLGLEYSGSVLGETEARHLLTNFDAAVSQLVNSPQSVAVNEQVEAPPKVSGSKRFESLGSLIIAHSKTSPHALAVSDGLTSLTYAQLAGRAEAVALALAARGTGIGSRVGVFAPRTTSSVVGILGTLRAGATYVALDPDYPAERLQYIADDAAIEAVVAAPADAPLAAELGLPLVISDHELLDQTQQSTGDWSLPEPGAQDAAYLIYTSGSTGLPKGVVVSHGNIAESTAVRTDVYGQDPEAFLLLSSFSFDSSMVGLFWSLTSGGSVILPEHGLHTDVTHLADRVSQMSVTHLLAVPALYRVLLEETSTEQLASLKVVIVAGEACPADLVVNHYRQLPSVGMHNEYGPTETTVWSHHFKFESSFTPGSDVPIGSAIPGVESVVLNADEMPAKTGEVGELLIGGFGVTSGYENRPSETAAKFIPAERLPQLEMTGTLYRTGDLVRVGDDGLLSFVGRADRQVKVRGFRVEPELVEAQLMLLAGVSDASVDLQDGRLVAWIATADHAMPAEPDRIKTALVGRLPAHEIPSAVISLKTLPRTVNGKIDREQLPPVELVRVQPADGIGVGLVGETAKIAQIWADVLGLDSVGVDENFFDLGGDSILNIRIVARMRQAGFESRPRDVVNNPTVAELVGLLATPSSQPDVDPDLPAAPEPMAGLVPMLEMQRWFFNQNFDDPNHWTQSLWVEIGEDTDLDAFKSAAQTLTKMHAILRSRFLRSGGNWTQFVADDGVEVDFSVFQPATTPEEVALSVESTLDIEMGRLMAVGLQPTRGGGTKVFVAIHHLVIDGVSWGPLLDDWTRFYEQLTNGAPIDLGVSGATQADWASAVSRHQSSHRWPVIQTHNTDRHHTSETLNSTVTLPADGTGALAADKIEAALVCAAGLAWCETRALETLEITLESHGRDSEIAPTLDLTGTIGWFSSLYPVVVELGAAPTSKSALAAVTDAIDSVPSLGITFDSGDPAALLPGLAFNYLGQLDRSIPTGSLFKDVSNFTAGISGSNHRPHDVGVVAWLSDGQLVVNWDGASTDISQEKLDGLSMLTLKKLRAISDGATGGQQSTGNVATTGVDATTMAALEEILGGLDI